MTKRYLEELANLEHAYQAACAMDASHWASALQSAAIRPAIMIGSGGSFSVASFAAYLHQLHTGRLASALTPLEYLDLPLNDAAVMCFSASGRNKDIAAAFEEAANREARPLLAMLMRNTSPLHELGERFRYSRLVSAESPHFKDGFLAVASLLATGTLLVRAYRQFLGDNTALPATLAELLEATTSHHPDDIISSVTAALDPPTTSVLFTASLKPAATDIESRFVEAALGNVHATDLRNFGHGRHHWFAKRADETGIIALIGDGQTVLADRTLALLPKAIPRARFDFKGEHDLQAFAGLITSLYIAASAGLKRGIDPGKPGVPEFGRKLYHLGPPVRRKSRKTDSVDIAAWRKQRASASAAGSPDDWWTICRRGIDHLASAKITGVVFDYDGTLCETHRRYEPLPTDVTDALRKLLKQGALLGIATGRGGSAAERMRETIPEPYWDRVLVGYYNGAVIAPLSESLAPSSADSVNPDFARLEEGLRTIPRFRDATFRSNANQLSFALPVLMEPLTAVRETAKLVEKFALKAVVACSSHSIDVTLGRAKKTNVVDALRRHANADRDAVVLRIGDKGRWPGNDADLLDDPFGLSVDEVSHSTDSCWGISPRGVLGVQATLYYLSRLRWRGGHGAIDLN